MINTLLSSLICVFLKAQKHRSFNSALTKQTSVAPYAKPVYSLIGPAHAHLQNGLMIDDDEAGVEEEADEEVAFHVLVWFSPQLSISSLSCFKMTVLVHNGSNLLESCVASAPST